MKGGVEGISYNLPSSGPQKHDEWEIGPQIMDQIGSGYGILLWGVLLTG